MYLQFHLVKEPSKNHDIQVRVLFFSLRVIAHFFTFVFVFVFSSW